MKEIYSKPDLEVINFEVNETIASCGTALFHHSYESCKNDPTDECKDFIADGVNFVADDTACTSPLYAYCYFTSNDSNTSSMLFNS